MDRPVSAHRSVNPVSLSTPWGFSHVVVPAPGRTIYLAGETGHARDGTIAEDLVEQFSVACQNVVTALAAADAEPQHIVSLQIFTTHLDEYLARSGEIGRAYRERFGQHFAASALVGVAGLVGGAKVELMCVAVQPEHRETQGRDTP
jgi:enamine deaminase RidA (YjgF/YER057c/UK114 family)